MRKFLLALCVVSAVAIGFVPTVSASEYRGGEAVLEHGHGGGWGGGHRGGWGGGRGGWGGGHRGGGWGGGRGGYYHY